MEGHRPLLSLGSAHEAGEEAGVLRSLRRMSAGAGGVLIVVLNPMEMVELLLLSGSCSISQFVGREASSKRP